MYFGAIEGVFNCAKACGNRRVSIVNDNVKVPSVNVCDCRLCGFCSMRGVVHVNSTNTLRSSMDMVSIIVTVDTYASSGCTDRCRLPKAFTPATDCRLITETMRITGRRNAPIHINSIMSSSTFCKSGPRDSGT